MLHVYIVNKLILMNGYSVYLKDQITPEDQIVFVITVFKQCHHIVIKHTHFLISVQANYTAESIPNILVL